MMKKISSNVTKTIKKKNWMCKCGASGVVNEYTQALICGSCGGMINEFTPATLLVEPVTIPESKLNE